MSKPVTAEELHVFRSSLSSCKPSYPEISAMNESYHYSTLLTDEYADILHYMSNE